MTNLLSRRTAAAVAALRDKLQPSFASPFDIRTNAGLAVAAPAINSEPGGANPVYVLTHVDVFPAGKDQTIELLKQLAEASRKESGSLSLDALQQTARTNHFEVVEIWESQKAQDAHEIAQSTKDYRAKVQPLLGAHYDQRVYEPL